MTGRVLIVLTAAAVVALYVDAPALFVVSVVPAMILAFWIGRRSGRRGA